MSTWGRAKQVVDLDWRQAWREIAAGTMGEDPPTEVYDLVEQLDCAYQSRDKLNFLALKGRIENHPWCKGSRPSSNNNPASTGGKSAATTPASVSLTLWDAFEDGSSPSSVNNEEKRRP